jgi:hypothetical protein
MPRNKGAPLECCRVGCTERCVDTQGNRNLFKLVDRLDFMANLRNGKIAQIFSPSQG